MIKISSKLKIYFLLLFIFLLLSFLSYFFFFSKPNDDIYLLSDSSKNIFENTNPNFSVNFGERDNPDKQLIRFEAKGSSNNPFSSENVPFFTKLVDMFNSQRKYGIEMSLVEASFNDTTNLKEGDDFEVLKSVAEVIGTDDIITTTKLVNSGSTIGNSTDTQSKKTVINSNVAEGIDIEYQILKGHGIKEEIIIKDLEKYSNNCGKDLLNCSIPLNKFVFNVNLDKGLVLKSGWFDLDGVSTQIFYFENEKGEYVAHILPSFATDSIGSRTYDVNLQAEEIGEGSYRVTLTVDAEWLLSEERIFPVSIDPSIVHDSKGKFDMGIFNQTQSEDAFGISLKQPSNPTIDSGVIGLWTFDEGEDVTNSILESGTRVVKGKVGKGRMFDGKESYIELLNIKDMVFDGYLDFSFWFKSEDVSKTARFGVVDGEKERGIEINFNSALDNTLLSNSLGIYIGDGQGNSISSIVKDLDTYDNEWHHIFLHTDLVLGEVKTVIDGDEKEVEYGIGKGPVKIESLEGLFTVGAIDMVGQKESFFNGNLDNFKISIQPYSLDRIKREILNSEMSTSGEYTSSVIPLEENYDEGELSFVSSGKSSGGGEILYSSMGLFSFYKFNEVSGNWSISEGECTDLCTGELKNFSDLSTKDIDPLSGWTSLESKWGNGALTMDGVDDFLEIHKFLNDYDLKKFSISIWVKPYSNGILLSTGGLEISYEDGKFKNIINDSIELSSIENYSKEKWHYLVVSYDGIDYKMYVNGQQEFSETVTPENINVGENILLGRDNSGNYFNGVVDSLAIYNRALNEYEIISNSQITDVRFLYRAGDGLDTKKDNWGEWRYLEKTIQEDIISPEGVSSGIHSVNQLNNLPFSFNGSKYSKIYFEFASNRIGKVGDVFYGIDYESEGQVYKSNYDLKVRFKANLEDSNKIESPDDMVFTINEVENLYVGDTIIISENIGNEAYLIQGEVKSVNYDTGLVDVFAWEDGGKFPLGGFSTFAEVFKWQKEYIDIEMSDNFEINILEEKSIRWGIRNVKGIRFEESSENTQAFDIKGRKYVQYKIIFNSKIEGITPFVPVVQVDVARENKPQMNQIMRHGKWFNEDIKQNYWWINN